MIVYHIFRFEREELCPVNDPGKSGDRNDRTKTIKTFVRDSLISACTQLLCKPFWFIDVGDAHAKDLR